MGKYRKILVALDGSASGRNALEQSFLLARDEKCWLTAAAVVPGFDGDLELMLLDDARAALRKPGEQILAEARALAEAGRVQLKTVLAEGEAWQELIRIADEERSDLVVMGRRGLRRLERVLMGSVTARVIGHSERDVLVVPQGTALSFKSILVATDGSPSSAAAADHAVDVAASYGGKLFVLSVVDLPDEAFAEAPNLADELLEMGRGYVGAVKAKADAAGVPCEVTTLEGVVHEVVVRVAREQGAGLIVTGSHGRTGLRRLLMGSVAEKVIGYAPCPVLVVKSI